MQLFLLSGLPLLVMAVAMGGGFLTPGARRWIERFIFVPGLWLGVTGFLVRGLVIHDRKDVIIGAGLMAGLVLNLAWVRVGRGLLAARAIKLSGTGTSQ